MARPFKDGLDYFPMDVSADQDDKFQIIEGLHGMAGFNVVIKLWMKIFSIGYYYTWEIHEQIIMAKRIGIEREKMNEIIDDALKFDLFSKKMFDGYGILTSEAIQRRYFSAITKRKECVVCVEYLLTDVKKLLNDKANIVFTHINAVNANNNSVNADNNKEANSNNNKRDCSNAEHECNNSQRKEKERTVKQTERKENGDSGMDADSFYPEQEVSLSFDQDDSYHDSYNDSCEGGSCSLPKQQVSDASPTQVDLEKLDDQVDYNTSESKKDKEKREVAEITKLAVDYLNQKIGSRFRADSKIALKNVKAQLAAKCTIEDFYTVIDKKVAEWQNTPFAKHLTPDTLFGSKFDIYLNQPTARPQVNQNGRAQQRALTEEEYADGGLDDFNPIVESWDQYQARVYAREMQQ